jgi:alpha-acetolactate decarboxylase
MKDDGLFYKEFCGFIKRMPKRGDMGMVIFDQVFGELQVLEGAVGKDTSKKL